MSITRSTLFAFLASFLITVHAQDSPSTLGSQCTFSCPAKDLNGLALVKRPNVVGFKTAYSIFECVYHSSSSSESEHKCSYYKPTGSRIMGYATDGCPPTAIPCDSDNPTPLFSNQINDEVPPWVEVDRYLLYLKEHHRG